MTERPAPADPVVAPERCSAISRADGEPLAGTAPVARVWFLVEHPGPWAKDPLATFPPPVAAAVDAAVSAAGARLLLVRRPGRHEVVGSPRWTAVDTVSGRAVGGAWLSFDDVVAAAEGFGRALAEGGEPAGQLILVCTHATRDACCAILGRPVAAELAARWPGEVWECSHLNGHRFAGTALLLPDGACLGGLDPDEAVAVVASHRAGEESVSHLRGYTRMPQPVQAAYGWALAELGAAPGSGSAQSVGSESVGSESAGSAGSGRAARVEVGEVRDLGDDRTAVELLVHPAAGPQPVEVVVERVPLPPRPVSCGKAPEVRHSHVVRRSDPQRPPA